MKKLIVWLLMFMSVNAFADNYVLYIDEITWTNSLDFSSKGCYTKFVNVDKNKVKLAIAKNYDDYKISCTDPKFAKTSVEAFENLTDNAKVIDVKINYTGD